MNKGDKCWILYKHEIMQGVIASEIGRGFAVDTELGRRFVDSDNCCTNEYSVCLRQKAEALELARNAELRAVRCQDTCLLEN
jgi:hypothetical protein